MLIVDEAQNLSAADARAGAPAHEPRDRDAEAAADHPDRPARAARRCSAGPSCASSRSASPAATTSSRCRANETAALRQASPARRRLRPAKFSRPARCAKCIGSVDGIPRIINVICDRALLGAFTQEEHRVDRAARARRRGRSLRPAGSRALAQVGHDRGRRGRIRADRAGQLELPDPEGWRDRRGRERYATGSGCKRQCGRRRGGCAAAVGRGDGRRALQHRAPRPLRPSRARDPDGRALVHTATTRRPRPRSAVCSRCGVPRTTRRGARAATRRCSKGSNACSRKDPRAQLRTLNRPAILTLTDEFGRTHQVVLTGLSEDTATLDVASTPRKVAISSVSRYWFGDFLLLWRPPLAQPKALTPGMRGADVRWLRESLRSVQGLPPRRPSMTTTTRSLHGSCRTSSASTGSRSTASRAYRHRSCSTRC